MCNAWNHWPSCGCGFGGDGHSGRSSGGSRKRYFSETRWGYETSHESFGTSSMTELAADLGHSLIFPVQCKYCGASIYLFASPDGGFAVFDELGPPWSKHWCSRLSQSRVIACSFPDPKPRRYTLPVPSLADFRAPSTVLKGIVVGVATRSYPEKKKQLWTVDVYDGKYLHRVITDVELALGACIHSDVDFVPEVGTSLLNPTQLLPPGYSEPNERPAEN